MIMQKQYFPELSKPERIELLEDNSAEIVENYEYLRELTEEELVEKNERVSEISIRVVDAEEIKKETVAQLNLKIKELKSQLRKILEIVRSRSEFVEETVYKFIDFEDGRVGFYNGDGVLVNERPIRPAERQITIMSSIKTA